jgi:hypothetical protein
MFAGGNGACWHTSAIHPAIPERPLQKNFREKPDEPYAGQSPQGSPGVGSRETASGSGGFHSAHLCDTQGPMGDAMPRRRFYLRRPLWRTLRGRAAGVAGVPGSGAGWLQDRSPGGPEKTSAIKPPKLSQPTFPDTRYSRQFTIETGRLGGSDGCSNNLRTTWKDGLRVWA